MSVVVWIGLGLLGGVGAIARFRFDAAVQRLVSDFPAGTFCVNVAGTFALGVLTGAGVSGDALLLAGTAVLGSFTTFSTWMLEAERAAEDGDGTHAGFNVVVSVSGGLVAACIGWLLGSAL